MFHGANEKHINVIEFGIIPLLLLLLLNKKSVITWTVLLPWISDMILLKESRLYSKLLSQIFLKKINYWLNNFK